MKQRLSAACCGLLVAGCSSAPSIPEASSADINAAASAAQNEIDRYAAARAAGDRRPARPVAATPVPADPPGPTAPAGPSPAAPPPLEAGSAQEGADLVRRYYALIAGHGYAEAWRLWDDGGKASQQTEPAFEAGLERYADYRADVGLPGEVDAGAGQRYVTVPIAVHARLKGGGAAELAGAVVLHRVGDIDGATAEQRQWHIHGIDLKPAPAPAPSTAPAR